MSENHLFYEKHIHRDREEEYIEEVLKKYRKEPVSDELKEKIWNELQALKYDGKINIPFKIVTRKDPSKNRPDYIEVILDTRV